MQKARVYRNGQPIGFIQKDEFDLYQFNYTDEYLNSENPMSISVNFPLQQEPFISSVLFSFFFNLLAEGVVKDIQCRELKIDSDDHFSRLLKTTESNTIGSITLKEIDNEMTAVDGRYILKPIPSGEQIDLEHDVCANEHLTMLPMEISWTKRILHQY